jgi:hypothetical protein
MTLAGDLYRELTDLHSLDAITSAPVSHYLDHRKAPSIRDDLRLDHGRPLLITQFFVPS